MKTSNHVFAVACVYLAGGFSSGFFAAKLTGMPFVSKKGVSSIAIFTGESPVAPNSPQAGKKPILIAKDVTDVPANFVAELFMLEKDSTWYMFFEVMNAKTGHGDIGLATSPDGFAWRYQAIVLDEPFHLSYPYVFKWNDDYYMIPESGHAYSVRLYKAVDFPNKWSFVATLMNGNYVDPSILHYNDKWWLFTETSPARNDTLRLFYADSLSGRWIEHPQSPIVKGDLNFAKPGGRVLLFDNRLVRYAQDDYPDYGNQLWAFEITELTTTSYKERQIGNQPILQASGKGWNSKKMHQLDPHRISDKKWLACVDGYGEHLVFGRGK